MPVTNSPPKVAVIATAADATNNTNIATQLNAADNSVFQFLDSASQTFVPFKNNVSQATQFLSVSSIPSEINFAAMVKLLIELLGYSSDEGKDLIREKLKAAVLGDKKAKDGSVVCTVVSVPYCNDSYFSWLFDALKHSAQDETKVTLLLAGGLQRINYQLFIEFLTIFLVKKDKTAASKQSFSDTFVKNFAKDCARDQEEIFFKRISNLIVNEVYSKWEVVRWDDFCANQQTEIDNNLLSDKDQILQQIDVVVQARADDLLAKFKKEYKQLQKIQAGFSEQIDLLEFEEGSQRFRSALVERIRQYFLNEIYYMRTKMSAADQFVFYPFGKESNKCVSIASAANFLFSENTVDSSLASGNGVKFVSFTPPDSKNQSSRRGSLSEKPNTEIEQPNTPESKATTSLLKSERLLPSSSYTPIFSSAAKGSSSPLRVPSPPPPTLSITRSFLTEALSNVLVQLSKDGDEAALLAVMRAARVLDDQGYAAGSSQKSPQVSDPQVSSVMKPSSDDPGYDSSFSDACSVDVSFLPNRESTERAKSAELKPENRPELAVLSSSLPSSFTFKG